MKRKYQSMLVLTLITLPAALPAALPAQETEAVVEEAAAAASEPLWQGQLGFSYLATTGNTETESLGLDLEAVRRPTPWGMKVAASFNRVEEENVKTAERYYAGIRGTRDLSERWNLFAGLSAERDEFSGIEQRSILELGGEYLALPGPRHLLSFDLALTWTDEQRVAPENDDSSLGGLLGLDYEFEISETAVFTQGLKYYANFDNSSDWRADSLTALTANLNQRLALRVGHEIRYRNLPIGANKDTDTTTRVSLVVSL